jgi:2'-5' RNA ligase
MRLFVSVNVDAESKSRLLAIQDKIKKQAARGNFSRPENLHLTLVFIGETPAVLAPAIISAIKGIPPGQKVFSVTFSRTGCFRHSGKELWWIGADEGESDALAALRRCISGSLEAANVPFDNRPFRAHVTLGREIKPSAPIELCEERITVPVRRVSLMKSEHVGGILAYTEVAGQDLPGE